MAGEKQAFEYCGLGIAECGMRIADYKKWIRNDRAEKVYQNPQSAISQSAIKIAKAPIGGSLIFCQVDLVDHMDGFCCPD
jgi:hypothetical protein